MGRSEDKTAPCSMYTEEEESRIKGNGDDSERESKESGEIEEERGRESKVRLLDRFVAVKPAAC